MRIQFGLLPTHSNMAAGLVKRDYCNAIALLMHGNFEAAVPLLHRVCVAGDPRAYEHSVAYLGIALANAGNRADAEPLLREALELYESASSVRDEVRSALRRLSE